VSELVEELRARWAVMGALERELVGTVAVALAVGMVGLAFAYLEARVKRATLVPA
jgi:hypothetical protein